MTSLAKLGRFARSWLTDFGPMCLIVGGFMAATVTMFWSFTQVPERPAHSIQQATSDAPPEMICECKLEPAPSSMN